MNKMGFFLKTNTEFLSCKVKHIYIVPLICAQNKADIVNPNAGHIQLIDL